MGALLYPLTARGCLNEPLAPWMNGAQGSLHAIQTDGVHSRMTPRSEKRATDSIEKARSEGAGIGIRYVQMTEVGRAFLPDPVRQECLTYWVAASPPWIGSTKHRRPTTPVAKAFASASGKIMWGFKHSEQTPVPRFGSTGTPAVSSKYLLLCGNHAAGNVNRKPTLVALYRISPERAALVPQSCVAANENKGTS
jgi:hypothetical protein